MRYIFPLSIRHHPSPLTDPFDPWDVDLANRVRRYSRDLTHKAMVLYLLIIFLGIFLIRTPPAFHFDDGSCKVSSGEASFLLNTLSFLAFQMYYKIQENVHVCKSDTPRSFVLQNKKSILRKIKLLGNKPEDYGIVDKVQTWNAGGHSKSRWLIVSSIPPHFRQLRSELKCLAVSLW